MKNLTVRLIEQRSNWSCTIVVDNLYERQMFDDPSDAIHWVEGYLLDWRADQENRVMAKDLVETRLEPLFQEWLP